VGGGWSPPAHRRLAAGGPYVAAYDLAEGTANRNGDLTIVASDLNIGGISQRGRAAVRTARGGGIVRQEETATAEL